MLTKEEAKQLYLSIRKGLIGLIPSDYGYLIRREIEPYIEKPKPKREVQVGDVYRDGAGNYETIARIDSTTDDYPIKTTADISYTKDGRYSRVNTSVADLDLSKRYRVMEITDDE